MRGILLALVAVALLSAGCGGSNSSSPAASASSSTASRSDSSPTQPATVPTWTVEEAGQRYLVMTKKGNADIARLTRLTDSDSLADFQSVCKDIADDMVSILEAAQSGKWPTRVRPVMRQWSKAVAEQRSYFAQCARAETIADAHDALTPLGQRNSSDESALVRAALRLDVPQA